MSSDHKIVLYNNPGCPYAQRVVITLKEFGVKYEEVVIDLSNKPEWYGKVNPDLKVPAITVDGKTFAESLVIIELLNDLYPEKKLLPEDPFKRASIRFAIEFFSAKIVSSWYSFLVNYNEEKKNAFIAETEVAFKRFAQLLEEQSKEGPYFLGNEYSLADVAITPFLGRLLLAVKYWAGDYKHEAIRNSPRLESFIKGALARPSYATTVDEAQLLKLYVSRFKLPPIA
ncbi:thioredoxin-like protein [Phycomyces nitens]|nr:thioredoxin-like protein [Phycomyces nitens]